MLQLSITKKSNKDSGSLLSEVMSSLKPALRSEIHQVLDSVGMLLNHTFGLDSAVTKNTVSKLFTSLEGTTVQSTCNMIVHF